MELGAVVCLPNGVPLCSQCPVSGQCLANRQNLTDTIPVRKKKKSRRVEKKTVLVIRDSERTLIRKRPDRGLLASLWELPCFKGHLSQEEALLKAAAIGVSPVRILPLPSYRHIFTHVEWEMTGFLILAEEMDGVASNPGTIVKEPDQETGRPDKEQELNAGKKPQNDFLTIRIRQMEENFPIPSAFARYTAVLGDER
jgi:A/G-specific adenine glycosylase